MVLIAPVTAPAEGLVYTSNNVKLKIGDKIIGNGILYIVHSSLAWQPDNRFDGISIPWKQISVHGVSNNPTKCIYFMLDHQITWRGVYEGVGAGRGVGGAAVAMANGNGGVMAGPIRHFPEAADVADEGNETDEDEGVDEDGDAEEEQMTECWLMPDDLNTVDVMFQAMTECQALHPDSADSISEESDFMDDDGQVGDDGANDDDGDDDARLGPHGLNRGDGGAAAAQDGMRNLNLNDDNHDAAERRE